tara:strand:+ start:249 stop:2711 length:2463 start_codon:yes stop_codon:yes gene_type:complete
MLLVSLSLENIKSYKRADIEFHHGLTAILGQNGAGKSTILEAIGFALFNYLRLNTAKFLRRGESKGQVSLVFTSLLNEHQYKITRTLFRKATGNKAEIIDHENGGVEATGAEATQNFIKEHLRLDHLSTPLHKIFSNVVGVPQGRLLADFSTTGEARRAIFDPIIGTKHFRDAYDKLKEPLAELKWEISTIKSTVSDLESIPHELAKLKEDLADQLAQEKSLRDEKQSVTNETTRLNASLELHSQTKNHINQASEAYNEALLRKETAKRKFDEARSKHREVREAAIKKSCLETDYTRYFFIENIELPRTHKALERLANLTSDLKIAKSMLETHLSNLRLKRDDLQRLTDLKLELPGLEAEALDEAARDEVYKKTLLSLQEDRAILKAKLALFGTQANQHNEASTEKKALLETLKQEDHAVDSSNVLLQKAIKLASARGYRVIELLNEKIASGDPTQKPRLESKLRSVEEQLQLCKPVKNSARRELEEAKRTIAESLPVSKKEYETLSKKSEPLRAIITEIEESMAPLSDLPQRKKEFMEYLQDLQGNRELYLTYQLQAQKYMSTKRHQSEALDELREETQSLRCSYVSLQESKNGLDPLDIDTNINVTTKKLQELSNLAGKFGAQLDGIQERKKEIKAKLKDHTEKQEKLKNEQSRLIQSESMYKLLTDIREAINVTGPEITRLLLENVSLTASELYNQIMDDWSLSLSWNKNYEILIDNAGHKHTFEELSGGEQVAAVLAIRLAMLKELLRFDLAFLDEPTQNLDSQKRDNLASQIHRLRGFKQLFVISHDDTFETSLENIISIGKTGSASFIESTPAS